MKSIILSLTCLLSAALSGAQGQYKVAGIGPISMDRTGLSTPMYLLDESGGIWRSTPDNLDVPSEKIGSVSNDSSASDLVAARVGMGNSDVLFIVTFDTRQSTRSASVQQYTDSGKFVCKLDLPETSLGVDISPKDRMLFVSGASSGTVYTANLRKPTASDQCVLGTSITPVYTIPNSVHLGALAFDGKHELFVADVIDGAVWEVNLRNPPQYRKVRELGQPVSLVMGIRHLYGLDHFGQKVFRIEVSRFGQDHSMSRWAVPNGEASCITLGSHDDELIVGDKATMSVYAVKKETGAIVGVHRMH